LDGPSIEITAHRVGYLGPSERDDIKYCDDQLTEDEIAIICGTYSLYTCKITFSLLSFTFSHILQHMQVKSLFVLGSRHHRPGNQIGQVAIGLSGQSGVKRFS
jgi:hypothetical protein